MEISRGNFAEKLPIILTAIEEADFISFDYEFTGLFTEKDLGLTDTYADRYERYRTQSVKFLPLQVGICTFKYDNDEKKYHYIPFNCYLFPHSSEQLRMSPKVFLLEGSSIDFLVKHKFDFNKSFYNGIGFGTLDDIEKRKNEIEKRYQGYVDDLTSVAEPSMTLPSGMKMFVDEKVEEVREFLAKKPGKEEELTFSDLNGYERKLLFTFLPVKVSDDPHEFTVETRYTSTGGPVIVVKPNLEGIDGKKKKILSRLQEQIENLELAMGFSKVVQALSKCDAILIGHNQGIDLLHTLNHFIAPLPESYTEFKAYVTTTFPRLVDTKFIALTKFSEIINNTSLSYLFGTVQSAPFRKLKIEPTNEDLDMSDNSKFHDASFDAFCTGYSLLLMLDYIAHEKGIEDTVKNADKLLKKYYHKIPVMNVLGGSHMNLGGPDELINRDNLYIINIPASWRTNDVHNALKTANIDSSNVYIHWINDTSAWIQLKQQLNEDDLDKLSKPLNKFRMVPFAKHIAQTSGDAEPSAKRMKVENGSEKSKTEGDKNSSAGFQVPVDW